ncbi:MAG: hypothetical protein ACE5H8_05890 [Alphaproteobacteria bacterium]
MTRAAFRPGFRILVVPFALAAFSWLAPTPLAAQEFDIPEGFHQTDEHPAAESDGLRYLFSVRPDDGPFAALSAIHLSAVTDPVADADAWLKERMTGDLGDLNELGAAGDVFSNPDSPFGGPAFESLRELLPELVERFRNLARIALRYCSGPETGHNPSGAFRELDCTFRVGPVSQYLVLRLQRAGGRWYYTEIRTMNERRLRHLRAIANSFAVAG